MEKSKEVNMYGLTESTLAPISPAAAPAALATGALPFTGLNTIWVMVIALTLFSVGMALVRFVPRREE